MKFQSWEKSKMNPQLKSVELVTLETYGRYQRTYQIYEDGTFVKMEHGDMPEVHIDTLKQKLEENGAIVWIDRSAYLTCERASIQEIAQSL